MADQKITALTNNTTVDDTDLVVIVDDVAGTPATEKRTVAQLKSHINTGMQAQPAEGAFVDGDKTKLDATIAPTGTPDGSKFLRDDGAWTAIGGGGDMLASNNLSDVANVATARTNLDVDVAGTDNAPTASTTVAGKVELATNTEATTGTDTTRAVTPAGVKAVTDALSLGIADVVDDTTPQLGGNLDVNGNNIVTTAGGDINLLPDTTGKVVIDGNVELDNFGAMNATYYRNGPDNLGLQVEAGGSSAGTSGNVLITGGDTTSGTGGDVILKAGAGGSGTAGSIIFRQEAGVNNLILDNSSITADRTLTMPDANVDLANVNSALQNITGEEADDLLATGITDGYVLTADGAGATAWEAVAGGGGGGNPYGATYVIGTGGDYTTLTAYQADSPTAGDILFIDGTVTQTADVTFTNEVHLIGVSGSSEVVMTGYTVTSGGNNSTIEGIKFTNAGNNNDKVYVYGQNVRISNCEFVFTGGSSYDGSLRTQSLKGIVENCVFTLSTYSNSGDILSVEGNNIKVTNNDLNSTQGIVDAYINIISDYVQVSGNNIGGGSISHDGKGIEVVSGGDDVLISNNTIYFVDYGVHISGNRPLVTGNKIYTTNGQYGIYFNATSYYATASGNLLQATGAGTKGIHLGTLYGNVTGNTIIGTGSGDTGVYVNANADYCSITCNNMSNVVTGINVSSSTINDTTIMGNMIRASGTNISDTGTDTFSATATDSDPLNREI